MKQPFDNIDPEFIRKMMEMRDNDIDAFSNYVLNALKEDPDFAVNDPVPVWKKLRALDNLLENFEERNFKVYK